MSVSLDFLEGVLARCPMDHATIVASGRDIYELVEIRYGALMVRSAEGFKLVEEEPYELLELDVTGFWYLKREKYEKTR